MLTSECQRGRRRETLCDPERVDGVGQNLFKTGEGEGKGLALGFNKKTEGPPLGSRGAGVLGGGVLLAQATKRRVTGAGGGCLGEKGGKWG